MSNKCDVCGYLDGHNSLVLIQCTECQVYVHRDCYGMPTYTKTTFQCWACQSVGKTFLAQNKIGEEYSIEQKTRPIECDLCGYDSIKHTLPAASDNESPEIHAMHPVYDNYGNKARQLFIIDKTTKKPRLVWAHTICGFFLSTKNLMYSTSKEGMTHEGEDSEPTDTRSINPDLQETYHGEDLFGGYAPTHHFVWHHEKPWKKQIQNHQLGLICNICKLPDDAKGCRRIAVQCSANDPDEYEKFQGTHNKSLGEDETCTLAFHVGCARWASGPKKSNEYGKRRVFYFPGLPNNDTLDPIRCIYCKSHANDVTRKGQAEQEELESMEASESRMRRKQAMTQLGDKRPRTLDTYSIHDEDLVQESRRRRCNGSSSEKSDEEDEILSLGEQMKRDLAKKVIHVTRDESKAFIKERKKIWERIALAKFDIEGDEFVTRWKRAKSSANNVWKAHNANK